MMNYNADGFIMLNCDSCNNIVYDQSKGGDTVQEFVSYQGKKRRMHFCSDECLEKYTNPFKYFYNAGGNTEVSFPDIIDEYKVLGMLWVKSFPLYEPNGYSLHLTKQDFDQFLSTRTSSLNKFLFPAPGFGLKEFIVNRQLYRKVENSKQFNGGYWVDVEDININSVMKLKTSSKNNKTIFNME